MILSTDMAVHFADLAILKGRLSSNGKNIYFLVNIYIFKKKKIKNLKSLVVKIKINNYA
jgi:hypothetical protein